MNESLLHLYELQKIDTQLDELIENRGGLPQRVEDLRHIISDQRARLEEATAHAAELEGRSKTTSGDSLELREKVEKYKAQQFDVKTTREYDAITFQLEDGQTRLNRMLEESGRIGIELVQTRSDVTQMKDELAEMDRDLTEQETMLKEVLAETQEEEELLLKKRAETLKLIAAPHISIYDRVRPAKNGLAVVPVKNGVCGGCFNAMPRQLVIELKRGERHSVCEYCGRIVVGDPIFLAVDGEPQPVAESTPDVEEETEG